MVSRGGDSGVRILVTDSSTRAALAAVRSLGRKGHTVFTAGESRSSLAAVSKYSSGFVSYRAPSVDPDAFVQDVLRSVVTHRIDVLLPMTEVTTTLLAQHRVALPHSCVLPYSRYESIVLASNKAELARLARELGVPTPETIEISGAKDAAQLLDTLSYPVVIKPSRSRIRTNRGWISAGVSYANDKAELQRRLQAMDPAKYPVLLQERINGPGVGFFACYDRGRLVATFAHERLREKPPSGGVSTLRQSVSVDPSALDYGLRLLNHLQWHGVAMVEFKKDERDGSLRLMEINARFWGSLQLAIDAGVDFPSILTDLAIGRPVAPAQTYRLGVRSRWMLGDFDVLLMVLLRSRRKLNLPPGFPSRLRFLWNFIRPVSNQYDEVMRYGDLRPGLLELRRWLFDH